MKRLTVRNHLVQLAIFIALAVTLLLANPAFADTCNIVGQGTC